MNYFKFEFDTASPEKTEILLALLADAGFDGFEEEDNQLKAYIREEDFNLNELDSILTIILAPYSKSVIREENWNAKWESDYEPVIVNDFVAVRASFHQPIQGVKHEIIVTPKMSFGTGHHATTYLMMEQMQTIDFKNKTVFDFGTGTGILAILAEKMGAAEVVAIDNDDWSIDNAKENIEMNGCKNILIEKADTIMRGKKNDIVLANINLNVISANLASIAGITGIGSAVLLSGFHASDKEEMLEKLSVNSIRCISLTQKGEWICMHCQTG